MYLERKSFLHSSHPTSKIISISGIFLFAMITRNIYLLVCALLFWVIIGIVSGCWYNLSKSLLFSFVIMIFSVVMWIFFYPVLGSTRDACFFGALMGFRLVNVFIAGIIFLSTTRIEEFIYGLRKLNIPYKLCFSISLAFRLIPMVYDTASIVAASQKIKGLDLKSGSFTERIKKYAPLLSPIMSHILRSANYLTIAVEARGFSSSKEKTEFLEFHTSIYDALIIMLPLLLNVLSIYLIVRK